MTTIKKTKRSSVVSPCFQIICICVSGVFILIGLHRGLLQSHIQEDVLPLQYITPITVKQNNSIPNIIKTGLYIQEFQTFDIIKNNFLFTGIVWFLFDPDSISLNILKNFQFDRGIILHRGEPDIRVIGKQLFARFAVRVQITSNLNYRYFPLDDHRLYFTLTQPDISPETTIFSSSGEKFLIQANTQSLGWYNSDKEVQFGYDSFILDPHDSQKTIHYPTVIFSANYERSGSRYVFSILLPLLLIFYLTLFSFSFGDLSGRTGVSLATGSITAILAYRFVIESLSPTTGYFMLSDYLFFLFLGTSTLVFLINIIDQFALNFSFSARGKKIVIVTIHTMTVLANWYLFILW